MTIEEKFAKLGVDNAPGQEVRKSNIDAELTGDSVPGVRVDFSHGDVNAFPPIPGSIEAFDAGYRVGAAQAYTEYRGKLSLREGVAEKLAEFTGAPVAADRELIVTPGTQGALFLAMGANIARGDKVAIVEPDYFANRKLVTFYDGELVPIPMDYFGTTESSGLDLGALEAAFQSGVKLFLFSNPNNPTGAVYTEDELRTIGTLANRYGVKVICDELYSRQIFDGRPFVHLRAMDLMDPDDLILAYSCMFRDERQVGTRFPAVQHRDLQYEAGRHRGITRISEQLLQFIPQRIVTDHCRIVMDHERAVGRDSFRDAGNRGVFQCGPEGTDPAVHGFTDLIPKFHGQGTVSRE